MKESKTLLICAGMGLASAVAHFLSYMISPVYTVPEMWHLMLISNILSVYVITISKVKNKHIGVLLGVTIYTSLVLLGSVLWKHGIIDIA